MSEPMTHPAERPALLVLIPLQPAARAALARHFELIEHPEGPDPALWERLGERAQQLRLVLSNGSTGLDAASQQRLPALGLIASFGAGYEGIDVAAARARGIAVTHAPGANHATVADHALALMLGLSRGLLPLDAAVRQGRWHSARAARPTLNGARLGLVGLGHIGAAIARRAEAFEMEVLYHTRQPRPEHARWRHEPDLMALARAADYLVLACPGGPATRHLANRALLQALGPQGYLINVARGSVLDTQALIEALAADEIAGAGLDVLEDEPAVPPALAADPRVLLTPHMAGRSPQAQQAQVENVLANLQAFLAGQALLTPVPG